MKVLVIDVGGNNVKISLSGRKGEPIKVPSGPDMTAAMMAAAVKKVVQAQGFKYDAVSIGYPGPVVNGRPAEEPANLGRGWRGFDYKKAFGKPVRVVNDAAMQALGSYQGGRMLFLGLGTGLGSAFVIKGVLAPMELAHLPYKTGKTYEDFVGARGLKRLGKKAWTEHVHAVVALLKHGLQCDYVVLGGGQTRKLKSLPRGVRVGDNLNAALGGMRVWEDVEHSPRRRKPARAHSQRRPPRKAAPKAMLPMAVGAEKVPSAS
jgi:predicted NBD/HSP70 family sugar kinase